jgi:hypothetical protein
MCGQDYLNPQLSYLDAHHLVSHADPGEQRKSLPLLPQPWHGIPGSFEVLSNLIFLNSIASVPTALRIPWDTTPDRPGKRKEIVHV